MNLNELRQSNQLLLESISGSRAYGLALPSSDTDYKGVFVLPKKQFYGLHQLDQVNSPGNDEVFYELRRFAELLAKNNPNILEMLNAPADCIVYRHPLFELFKPSDFLSKLCRDTFAGYAITQIKKARGLNKKIHNPQEPERKTPLHFCYVVKNQGSIALLKWLEANNLQQERCGLVNIPNMRDMYALFYDHSGDLQFSGVIQKESANEVALSSVPKGTEPLAIMSFNKDGYSAYCKSYREYWDWVKLRNEERYQNTLQHGKNYDAKNMMHTFRLLDMAAEILRDGEVIVRRPNREELLAVRRGEYLYEDLILRAEEKIAYINELYERCTLPELPDLGKIEDLILEVRERFYAQNKMPMPDQPNLVFPPHLHFAHPWRNYQQKILEETDLLLNQGKFHLVAPPGSGKTILGLELMRRLDRKTLILAPTLVIREQWIERLIQDFGAETGSDWISRDLHDPALLTVCTYQALHQAWKTNPQIITQLQQAEIGTLIVDECHHLQKEWWKPLINLKKELNPLLIALTATPPYDVNNFEWARYHELCGDIDEIIYTPELVAAGDLCPHQDYLYLCMPPDVASRELQDFHRAVVDFTEGLQHNYRFINLLKEHPWLNQPELYTEAIYENPAYFSALLIGLEGLGKVAPLSALGIIGADESQIPTLSLDWLEVLLQNALFKDPYFEAFLAEEPIERIIKTLRRIGAIEKARVYLKEPPQLAKRLRNSVSKLHAIEEIAKIEAQNLGKELRMVVLCDYIRKELLPTDELDDPNQDQLGVVPIFESLRRAFPLGLEIGVLSGSLVIVPKASEPLLNQVLSKWNIPVGDFRRNDLKHAPLYLHIEPVSAKAKSAIVNVITMLFAQGGIQALVGTTALLGEGWDAPEINTLVLATFVGSHVLSNQMRGRAIRVHRQIVEKTANIWHLACIDPRSPEGGSDVLMLKRRMSTFFGLGQGAQPIIISGMDRFALPTLPIAIPELEHFNYNTAVYAKARPRLQQVWQEAIGNGYAVQEKVRVPHQRNTTFNGKKRVALEQSRQVYRRDFKRFNVFAGIWVIAAFVLVALGQFFGWVWGVLLLVIPFCILLLAALDFSQLRRLRWVPQITRYFKGVETYRPRLGLRMGLYTILIGGVIWQWGLVSALALVTFILAGWLVYLSFFNSTFILGAWSNLRRIKDPQLFWSSAANALFEALSQIHLFQASSANEVQLEIEAKMSDDLMVVPKNLDTHNAQLYLNALQELLNPIENPRYLLALKYTFDPQMPLLYYFPVPTCLGKKKKDAELFQDIWAEKMGPTRLVFTRTVEGRLELLKARGQSLGLSPEAYAARESSWE